MEIFLIVQSSYYLWIMILHALEQYGSFRFSASSLMWSYSVWLMNERFREILELDAEPDGVSSISKSEIRTRFAFPRRQRQVPFKNKQ